MYACMYIVLFWLPYREKTRSKPLNVNQRALRLRLLLGRQGVTISIDTLQPLNAEQ